MFTARRFPLSIWRTTGAGTEFLIWLRNVCRRKSDIIAVTTTPAAKAAKERTQTVPIVMLSLGDPVRTGLVRSNLARPEGNVTGMSNMGAELVGKTFGAAERDSTGSVESSCAYVSCRPYCSIGCRRGVGRN